MRKRAGLYPESPLEFEEEGSDRSVRPPEDDSDDELRDGKDFMDLATFLVIDELSSEEEDGGELGGEEGNEEGVGEGSEDLEKDVPLAQRKVARV